MSQIFTCGLIILILLFCFFCFGMGLFSLFKINAQSAVEAIALGVFAYFFVFQCVALPIGLTKYLATYWAKKGIRVNTFCLGGISNGQDEEFVRKLSDLIPMGRMINADECVCTILYMLSDASSYMTGATVVLDGGKTIW